MEIQESQNYTYNPHFDGKLVIYNSNKGRWIRKSTTLDQDEKIYYLMKGYKNRLDGDNLKKFIKFFEDIFPAVTLPSVKSYNGSSYCCDKYINKTIITKLDVFNAFKLKHTFKDLPPDKYGHSID